MKKEELEAILGNGDQDLDLGPIEEHLHALATERKLPALALGLCTIRIEGSAPALRALLERTANGVLPGDDETRLLFRGLCVLGAAQDKSAYGPLLRLLRRPSYEIEYLLGDLVTENLARIVIGTFDGNSETLFELIRDPAIDGYVREALFGAAAFLTWKGLIERERTERHLVKFYEDRPATDQDQAWHGWLATIALLGLRHLAPLVRSAWDEGRVPEDVLEWSDFEQDLAEAEQKPDDTARFEFFHLGYIEDVLVALEWCDYVSDEDPPSTRTTLSRSAIPSIAPIGRRSSP
jgi:hypothetical protein